MRANIEHGDWSLSVYPWHSINIMPHASTTPICRDDTHDVYGRALWLTIFGVVVVAQWPSPNTVRRSFTILEPRGMFWSRRRRAWYKPVDIVEVEHS
jgi:hypothetical protein